MKFCDKFKLMLHEYRYEKLEWIISVLLQCLIFTSVLFLFTVAIGIDDICGIYMKPLYEDGYEFALVGYTKADMPKLEQMGFRDITFSQNGESIDGVRDNLTGIWIYKLQAAFDGKDIWNEGLEEILGVMLFCQVILGAIGVAMLIIMLNNLSNSFAMKLMRRQRYIQMMEQLGCSKKICQSIYYGFFGIRNVVALLISVIINSGLVSLLNKYMKEQMYIPASFQVFDWGMMFAIFVVSMSLMWLSFRKQWRQMNEK